jgi:hypothetical protein
VESAAIGLPDFFSPGTGSTTSLIGTNLLIGTGGLSGTIGLDNPEGFINVELNQFKISITDFDIVFKQGKVVSSEIKGLMTIPGFENSEGEEAEIEIDIHIGDEGDFMITASETEGITAISIPDVLDLKIYSLSVGKEDDKFFVATSGLIDFTATDGGSGDGQGNSLLPQDVPIKKLIIWEDGVSRQSNVE